MLLLLLSHTLIHLVCMDHNVVLICKSFEFYIHVVAVLHRVDPMASENYLLYMLFESVVVLFLPLVRQPCFCLVCGVKERMRSQTWLEKVKGS